MPPAGLSGSGMVAIPSTVDPGGAKQTGPEAPRSFVRWGAPP